MSPKDMTLEQIRAEINAIWRLSYIIGNGAKDGAARVMCLTREIIRRDP